MRVGEADHPRRAWLPLTTLPLVAIALLAPMFAARLGAVDDHQIVAIQGLIADRGYLGTWQVFASEANGRFRPFYWAGFVCEAAFWGQNVAWWYVDRLALLLVTLGAGYALARLWVPSLPAVLAALLIVAGPQAEAFYRLGPQESYAMVLALTGLALVGRRRFAMGLGLACLPAFVKEPFVIVSIVAIAWSWRLGARAPTVAAAAVTLVAGAAIMAAIWTSGGGYYAGQGLTNVPMQGRYLYPAIAAFALVVGWLVARHRWLVGPVALLILIGVITTRGDAERWAAETRSFAGFVDELRADPRPLVVTVTEPWAIEPALALRRYLPGRAMELQSPVALPGFAPVGSDCLEVTIVAPASGRCPDSIASR